MLDVEVSFADIDARDCLTGYDPVGFLNSNWKRYYPLSHAAMEVEERMQREYLVAVGRVREEIAAKYAALCTEELFTLDREKNIAYNEMLPEEVVEAINKEFPGNPATYYT